MDEVRQDPDQVKEPSGLEKKSPAQKKWDEQRGEEFVYVAEWLRKGSAGRVFVYELVYRVDVLDKDDPMLLVKGIEDGLPVVAFVYGPGLLTGMANLAGLFRSGKLKWRPDVYPSNKVKKWLAAAAEGWS